MPLGSENGTCELLVSTSKVLGLGLRGFVASRLSKCVAHSWKHVFRDRSVSLSIVCYTI